MPTVLKTAAQTKFDGIVDVFVGFEDSYSDLYVDEGLTVLLTAFGQNNPTVTISDVGTYTAKIDGKSYTPQEISAIIEKFNDPDVDSLGYLKDTLLDYRRRYDAGSSAYAAIDRLIADCKAADKKNYAE